MAGTSTYKPSFHRHMAAGMVGPSALLPPEGIYDRCIELPSDSSYCYEANKAHILKQETLIQRPARKQIENPAAFVSAYTEGQEGYNIWYHKFASKPGEYGFHPVREPAETRCNPDTDVGYTKADTTGDPSGRYYCFHFAKGSCGLGANCMYRHRLPTEEDEYTLEASRDVFGRERHADHRDDMGGVGSFESESKTLYVGRIHVDKTRPEFDPKNLLDVVVEHFGAWGPIETLRVLPRKGMAFIAYMHRTTAEFAKVAMSDQNLGNCGVVINVRWAHELSKEHKERIAARNAREAALGKPSTACPKGISITPSNAMVSSLLSNSQEEKYLDMYFKSLEASGPDIGPASQAQMEEEARQRAGARSASRMQTILSGIENIEGTDPFKVVL